MFVICATLLRECHALLETTLNYAYRNLETECNEFSPKDVDESGPPLRRDSMWFDSFKLPPPVSDHCTFAVLVVAYGRFDCNWLITKTRLTIRKLEKFHDRLVSSQPFLGSSRMWGGALRDEPKNGCEGD